MYPIGARTSGRLHRQSGARYVEYRAPIAYLSVDILEQTKVEKVAENRRLTINELMEKVRDTYWRVEEKGNDEQTGQLIKELKSRLEPVINSVRMKENV
ncbi:hypothetical protein Glove_216g147 [Diversispora epigaea]|uniref:Uncharacterized protein n=1 Tax=Diversispora epigaea TaxID=1348612 RepID=A0A397IHA2_9GLOM|nr:hypothetical protein Glove_216g147 [Diversispora epigaea]